MFGIVILSSLSSVFGIVILSRLWLPSSLAPLVYIRALNDDLLSPKPVCVCVRACVRACVCVLLLLPLYSCMCIHN